MHTIKFFFKNKTTSISYPKYPIQGFLPDLLHHQLQRYVSHAYIWDTEKHSYFEPVLKPVKVKERMFKPSTGISIIHLW